jgi:general secretion pathway protein E
MINGLVAAMRVGLHGKSEPTDTVGNPIDLSIHSQPREEDEESRASAAADILGVPFVESLSEYVVSEAFVEAVPIVFARRHAIMGFEAENGSLTVALAGLSDWPHLQSVGKVLSKRILPVFSTREEIVRVVNVAYERPTGHAERLINELDGDNGLMSLAATAANEDLLDVSGRAPVIRLVNLVLLEAVKRRASDVHIQPYADRLVVRFRIDGVLRDVFEPPPALRSEITSRVKIMGGMNIAEQRLAQDGRATVEVGNRIVDLRISTLPTSFGERTVIRLLDKGSRLYALNDLGMPSGVLEPFRRLVNHDHGLILVTGPTGSGKSTTLYAALQEINSRELNVLTLEDPIEFRLDGISQTQVSERKGMTFASGLRHVLRQDPDIIMIGEIRDSETARMAIQSALTGHLVFSTLHTNDAAGAVTRMLDLGVESYLLASSLLGVMAQRLVRRLCMDCRVRSQPTPEDCARWGLTQTVLASGQFFTRGGCPVCQGTGYRDRMGIFELLQVTEPIRELILQRGKASSIKRVSLENGMTTLRAAGIAKAAEGTTTLDEVVRVTGSVEF